MCPKVSKEYKEATKRRVLEAAERVFARKGYQAASMDDVVRESGLSKGAIYGYFESKEELFLGLQALQGIPTQEEIVAAIPAGASATERLTKAGEFAFQVQARLDRDTARVAYEFWTAAPRIKAIHRHNAARYQATHRFLEGLVRDGIKRGEFRKDIDPEALASILMASVDGLGLHWACIGAELDWGAIQKTFLTLVREGITTAPRRLP